jgi:hypothetical protein
MKQYLYIFLAIILCACNGENVPDCFQNSGDVIVKEFPVTPFTKITVFEHVEMILKEAPDYKVTVSTGEYLMDEVEVIVEGDRLKLYDNNGCNLTRDYGITKITVEAPNVDEIRSSTGLPIRSLGVLNYPNLTLLSEDFNNSEAITRDGLFDLEVNATNLRVTVNALSTMYIKGFTENLSVSFVSGDARFESRFLIAENVTIYHRGTNDITVNPQQSLNANLVSTGDVIVVNTPQAISVQEQYSGRVIFE